ncbi:proteasome regulatory particle base subunit [Cryptotrichosporon argae]
MADRDPAAADILVPARDPAQPDDNDAKDPAAGKEAGAESAEGKRGKGKAEAKDELSEEDAQLKAELEMLVERLKEPDTTLYLPALESLRTLIKTSTSSMTSVPKPLKFLRPHYEALGAVRDGWDEKFKDERSLLASILSVLAMTYSDSGKRDTLYYRLISGSTEAPGTWGHEYVRHLAAELGEEYVALTLDDGADEAAEEKPNGAANGDAIAVDGEAAPAEHKREYTVPQLQELGLELADFFLKHNAEADAVDLLLELESISKLTDRVDDKAYPRVCQYLVSCVPLLVPPDDEGFLYTAAAIYARHDRYPEALSLAIRLHDRDLVRRYFEAPKNPVMQKQLAYILSRAGTPLHWVHASDSMQPEDDEVAEAQTGGRPPTLDDDLVACLGAQNLSTHFRNFGAAVGVADPRTPDDIYKTHLEARPSSSLPDSARQNLAATFVNAFVNAGFGNETLVSKAEDGESFIYKNKAEGMMSATASVGLGMLWDHEGGINHVDKYTFSPEEHVQAGAYLATGILFANVRTDPDVCFALLEDHIDNPSAPLKTAVFNALAIAYAGSERHDIANRILPYIQDEKTSIEVAANAAIALGFIFVGSGEGDIASAILQSIMERESAQFASEWTIFLGLALGLIFLGRKDASDATLETLKVIDHPMARTAAILVDVCSFAATGNVLKVQQMLHVCAEHAAAKKKGDDGEQPERSAEDVVQAMNADPAELGDAPLDDVGGLGAGGDGTGNMPGAARDVQMGEAEQPAGVPEGATGGTLTGQPTDAADPTTTSAAGAGGAATGPAAATATAGAAGGDDDDDHVEPLKHQAVAVIGIALVAMGEEVGAEMALRQFQHLMTYGDPVIRKSVPLALGLISASNPQLSILDTLSKYSHDSDLEVAANAIFAMGLVGAGTNNARLAQMLRALATYYAKEPDCLFLVRVAQGLVHMGKGTIGLNPFFNDRQTMSRQAVAGLLAVIVSFTEAKTFVLGKHHWMLYYLATAMYPQFLITLDEAGEEKAVTVRVGQAVNTIGLAGTRSGISGFQTHQTPVRIATGERAELGTNEFFAYSSVLEGFVFLKKNEGYDAED